mmetsp:Transcript_43524/g.132454  ORF Transcript_43524/g.132454 Transcript_43524/m.132454 type:complete len:249 (+) Transcript_43524:492-1238(+)
MPSPCCRRTFRGERGGGPRPTDRGTRSTPWASRRLVRASRRLLHPRRGQWAWRVGWSGVCPCPPPPRTAPTPRRRPGVCPYLPPPPRAVSTPPRRREAPGWTSRQCCPASAMVCCVPFPTSAGCPTRGDRPCPRGGHRCQTYGSTLEWRRRQPRRVEEDCEGPSCGGWLMRCPCEESRVQEVKEMFFANCQEENNPRREDIQDKLLHILLYQIYKYSPYHRVNYMKFILYNAYSHCCAYSSHTDWADK